MSKGVPDVETVYNLIIDDSWRHCFRNTKIALLVNLVVRKVIVARNVCFEN